MSDLNNIVKGALIQEDNFYSSDVLCSYMMKIRVGILSEMKAGTIVAVALPRNVYLITTILACLEKGVPFLMIDVEQPKERIDYMLSNAGIEHVITSTDISYDFGTRTVYKVEERLTIETRLDEVSYDTEIAYILYTSGTTGKPKAVAVRREGFFNFIEGIPEIIEFIPEKKIACFTNFTFDIFFLEAVLPMYLGQTVILATASEENNARKMAALLKKHEVNMIQMTPSRIRLIQMVDNDFECLKGLETIMVGGEVFPQSLLEELQAKTNARIYNMYGPTETTIWSTVSELTNKTSVTIGQPIKETRIYLLSDDMKEVANGEVGEICIAGKGLAKGYVNDDAQTNQKFISLPFEPFERIYKTGDLGKYDADGNLLCLGRIDSQIKLMGHRIELEDIESNLMDFPEIKSVAACFNEEHEKIIAFYMAEKEIENIILIDFLQEKLPQYMIPSKFILVDHFPYTTSGKMDRKTLLNQMEEIEIIDKNEIEVVESNDDDEVFLSVSNIIKSVLDEQSISINQQTTLEELSINSFLFVNIVVVVEETYEIEFDMEMLDSTEFVTIGEFVTYVKEVINNSDI